MASVSVLALVLVLVLVLLLARASAIEDADYFDGPSEDYGDAAPPARAGGAGGFGAGLFKDLPKILMIVFVVFAFVILFTIYVIYRSEKHSKERARKKKRAYKMSDAASFSNCCSTYRSI